MEPLGQYLVTRGVITQTQLGEARQAQAVFGGRLGTNLVELGYMSLQDLAEFLARRAGTPAAPQAQLESPDAEALATIPAELAVQHKVLPFRIDGNTLHVAMVDPEDGAVLDQLTGVTGKQIRPYVVAELQLFRWHEKHLGIKREIRFARLGRQYTRGPGAGMLRRDIEPPSGRESEEAAPPVIKGVLVGDDARDEKLKQMGMRPLGDGEELSDADNFDPFGGVVPEIAPTDEPSLPELEIEALIPLDEERTPTLGPADIATLTQRIQSENDRDEITELGLTLARCHAEAVAVFAVHQGMLQGFRGAGAALDNQDLRGVLLPSTAESILRESAVKGEAFHGPPPDGEINQRLLRALGRPTPAEVIVLPIRIGQRIVSLLYADNGERPFHESSMEALRYLTEQIGAGYERAILARKKS